jgi:hypothetical protein
LARRPSVERTTARGRHCARKRPGSGVLPSLASGRPRGLARAWCVAVLRRPTRELYRVYDEHEFLSGASVDDPAATHLVRGAGAREHGFLAVLALLLLAGAAGALVTLEPEPHSAAPRGGARRSLATRILAVRPRPKSSRGPGGDARHAREQPSRRSSRARSPVRRRRGRSLRATSGAWPATATETAAVAVKSAGARLPAREFGFEQ